MRKDAVEFFQAVVRHHQLALTTAGSLNLHLRAEFFAEVLLQADNVGIQLWLATALA